MAEVIAALSGFVIGILGTLIGAGGGFFMVPVILFLEPHWSTDVVTAFSLAVVAANATTGAIAYRRAGRVDLRSFGVFSLAAVPGAVLGAMATSFVPRSAFNLIFGVTLVLIGVWLFVRPARVNQPRGTPGHAHRSIRDRHGHHFEWWFDMRLGIAGSAVVGFLSSLLGIGGGIVHVPFLTMLLNFPEHVATATSHSVLAVTAIVGTVIHVIHGDYRTDAPLVLATSLGAIAGAPVGAHWSRRVPGRVILRILGTGLTFVGMRLLFVR